MLSASAILMQRAEVVYRNAASRLPRPSLHGGTICASARALELALSELGPFPQANASLGEAEASRITIVGSVGNDPN